MKMSFRFSSTNVILSAVVAVAYLLSVHAWWTELELVGIENSNSGQCQTAFRPKRVNKSVYSVDGTFQLDRDYKYDFDCEVKLYYSSQGNNQYKLQPYKVAKQNCSDMFESWFWKAVHRELERVSDLPKSERQKPVCFAYKKGNYTVRRFIFDRKALPIFLHPGTYKAVVLVYHIHSIEIDSRFAFIARVY